jgi:hypothetical protein
MKYDSEWRCNDDDRKTDVLGEKHVSVPICPAQIPEIGLVLSSNLHDERPETNCMRY